ncbi:MAG: ABC transporter substrate-binding protein [Caldisphaeraceae archaeon]|nr:ABC transporter substrate-binding protein [Caldisphaeraceae archaeon]
MGENPRFAPFLALVLLIPIMLIGTFGIAANAFQGSQIRAKKNTYASFPYAKNYPVFSVANGAGPFVKNWNVFAPSVRYGDNNHAMAYILEPLGDSEQYTGYILPILATSWSFANNYHELIVHLRHGVYYYYKFPNGTTIEWPFTAKDVVVTFELYFKVFGNPYGVHIIEVNPYEVIFNFTVPNIPYALYTILSGQYIVPWEQYAPLLKTSNPAKVIIAYPIGTGPYYLGSFSTNLVTLYRNPIYWIPGRPFLSEVKFYGAYNAQIYAMLAKGQMQWASSGSNGPTSMYKLFIANNPKYYHAMMGIPNGSGGNNWVFYINNKKLNYYPWNTTWFRKAIVLAINYTQLTDVATGYLKGGGVQLPNLAYMPPLMAKSWLNSTMYRLAMSVSKPNLSESLKILKEHGLKIINGKLSYSNGTPLPSVTMYNFVSWGDVYAQSYAFVQEMKTELGLQIKLVSVSPSTLYSYLSAGKYELAYWNGYFTDLSPVTVWGFLFIPPLVTLKQLPNGKYVANITKLKNTVIKLPNGTLIANITAARKYLLSLASLEKEKSPLLSKAKTVYVANITAVENSTNLPSDWCRWIPPQKFINLYIEAGKTSNYTKLKNIYSEMQAIIAKNVPMLPFVTPEWPFEEWEDQYYIGYSTPQYLYWLNVYVGNAMGPSTPILLNIAPRPPGMTNSEAMAFTKQAWKDLLSFLYGRSSTATPQSLLSMLGVSITNATQTSIVSTKTFSTTKTYTTTKTFSTTKTYTTTKTFSTTKTYTTTKTSTYLGAVLGISIAILILVIITLGFSIKRKS